MKDVFWIQGQDAPHLAIVLRPRGEDWLEDELLRMKQNGIETLVSMLEPEESDWLGLREEGKLAESLGMTFLVYPIPDTQVPCDTLTFRVFVEELAKRLSLGERIGVHCRGSIGRATIAAACTLILMGWEPEAALDAVEATRGCQVPDTPEQKAWILQFESR